MLGEGRGGGAVERRPGRYTDPEMPKVLTIAGSDSGGGAGIQADLKTFSALRVYGMSVITAITAQNTVAVTAVQDIPADVVAAQIDAVATDLRPDAVKIGMLSNAGIIEAVAAKVQEHALAPLIVDPVMVAKSGDRLLREDAVAAMVERLLPLADVVTPNLPEAAVLAGQDFASDEELRQAARAIVKLGAKAVVMKGGHDEGDTVVDVLFHNEHFHEYTAPRIHTQNTHGTGCTFASAIAALMARGEELPHAVRKAKEYVTEAIKQAYPLGSGHGPVHHFWEWWTE